MQKRFWASAEITFRASNLRRSRGDVSFNQEKGLGREFPTDWLLQDVRTNKFARLIYAENAYILVGNDLFEFVYFCHLRR